ncbi:hypothetical protein MKK64_02130 [Methylobacterium sp. E-025]|uniref:hypothetical protein n=1 Tax=Methylobacterium sp. E-025 TaxID=2836561 RepID=UPI001FB8F40D|nr:hypothetical protein [Methylobacterium sp. E-025]MCJ2110017.1 hypothetical protein [Methylobacterium sp. E-025]
MSSDTPIGFADLNKSPVPPRYHVLILDRRGQVLRMERIESGGDDEVVERALRFVDGQAIELWDGVRFIEHFPPVD